MLGFPKVLHQLHLFEEEGVPYAADLDKARVVELSTVMMDILKLAETQTDDAIVETVSASYEEEDISEAFERFAELEREGLLFNRGEDLERSLATESKWRKLLVVIPGINVDSFFDIETLSAGTNMALAHMITHLTITHKLFSNSRYIFNIYFLHLCELDGPEDAEDPQHLFARPSLYGNAEPIDGVVSRKPNNTALHLSTFPRERTHRLCVLLVRYLLTGGFQTLLGVVSDSPVIAF